MRGGELGVGAGILRGVWALWDGVAVPFGEMGLGRALVCCGGCGESCVGVRGRIGGWRCL